MDLLESIKTYLTSAGVVDGITWQCFIGYAPDAQDQIISLHYTGGLPQDTHGGENISPTFQLHVRTGPLEHAACANKWWQAVKTLNNADMSAQGIALIQSMATGPLPFNDEKNRVNMTANFRVVMRAPV